MKILGGMLPAYWEEYIPPWICTHGYEEIRNYRKTLFIQKNFENGWWGGCISYIPPPGSAPAHANLDTASEDVGYINKMTAARLLKQAFSCMATCIIICWSPSLLMRLRVSSLETRCGEQKLLSHPCLSGSVATFEQY